MPYAGKIVDYRQQDLPDGKVEVTFSIDLIKYMVYGQCYMQEEYPYQENKQVKKWKLEIPTSYRIVFGPKNKARIYMGKKNYEADVDDLEKYRIVTDKIHKLCDMFFLYSCVSSL